MIDPLVCERCRAALEPDDAVSIIEGICPACRGVGLTSSAQPLSSVDALLRGATLSLEDGSAPAEDQPRSASAPRTYSTSKVPAGGQPTKSVATPRASSPLTGAVLTGRESWSLPGLAHAPALAPKPVHQRSPQHAVRPYDGGAAVIPPQVPGPMACGAAGAYPRAGARRRRRDLAVGVTVGLIITICVAGYFLGYRGRVNPLATAAAAAAQEKSVRLTVTPAWATVTLDDEIVGPPDASGKLDLTVPENVSATASLQVTAEGYHSARRPLASLTGVNDVFIELVRRPYQVVVRTNPPQAEVWIDNQLKGYTPLTLSLMPTETPAISVRRAGYAPVVQKVSPPEHGDTVNLDVSLTAANLVMQVESEPPGAMIATDGIVRGPSPLAVEMDPSYAGKEVEVAASLQGYEDATTNVALPSTGTTEPIAVRLAMIRKQAVVEFWTTPPGGHVVVDGKEIGAAPVVVKFDPGRVGSTITAAAALGASYHGKQELAVPPVGDPLRTTIVMELNVQRVVFILSCPKERAEGPNRDRKSAARKAPAVSDSSVDALLLADQLVETIGGLKPQQRFAVLLETENGIESWPGEQVTEAATSEQKIRAYDVIRSARLAGGGLLADAVQRALALQADTVWVFAAGAVKESDFERLEESPEAENVAVHFVRASSDEQDEWLRDLAARHQGTLTLLGRGMSPTIVMGRGEQ